MDVWVLSFLVFAISQVGTPGPANMALLATGARYGFRAALPFVAGVAFGKQLIIWPIGFGLMGLAATAPWLFVALKYVSAGYIFWLAWRVANMRLDPGRGRGGGAWVFRWACCASFEPKGLGDDCDRLHQFCGPRDIGACGHCNNRAVFVRDSGGLPPDLDLLW
jgi:hypothetical protein